MLLLGSVACSGQVFSIGAPKPALIAGESITLTPLLRDPAGNLINASDWAWSTTTPSILSIDSSGRVKGLGLGTGVVRLTAPKEAGTLFGQLQIQVQPSRVAVTPAAQTINVGSSIAFTAAAYDLNDSAIPNAPFVWAVTASDGRQNLVPSNVTVDGSGRFQAGSMGRYTVHALIDYLPVIQGTPSHFEALAQVTVVSAPAFHQDRLMTSDPIPTKTLLPAPGVFTGSESGAFLFTSSADGYSAAVIAMESGKTSAVITTGQPSPQPGGVIAGYQSLAMNAKGDALIAIKEGDSANGALLARPALGVGGARFVLLDDANGIDATGATLLNLTYLSITPFCLNDNGTAVIRALYYPQDSNVPRDGLFLLRNAMTPQISPQLLWSAEQGLPSVAATGTPARIQFIFDNTERTQGWTGLRGLGIDNSETVYFMAQSGSSRGLFQIPAGGAPQKIVAVGDTLGTSKVKDIQDLSVLGSGDVAVRVDTQDGNVHMTIYRQAKSLGDVVIPGNPNPRVLSVSAAGLLFEGISGTGKPEGLYLWKPGGTPTSLLSLSANVTYISAAWMNSKGTATAVVRSPTNDFLLVQPPAASSLFASGAASSQMASPDIQSFIKGWRAALPSVAISDPHGIFDLDGAGGAVGRVVPGQTLTGGVIFGGADNFAEDSSGAQYFVTANALFRYSGGAVTQLVANNTKASDGVTLIPRLAMGVSAQGAVLVDCITNAADGHRRLYKVQGGALTLITRTNTAFGSRQIQDWTEAAIDDAGNVAVVYLLNDGSQELVVWSGATSKSISNNRGGSLLGNEQVARFNRLRAAGSNFYARVALTGDFIHAALVRFTSGSTQILVRSGDSLPDGTTAGDLRLTDVNHNGDAIFTTTVVNAGTQALLSRSNRGDIAFAASNDGALQTGDYLARFSDVTIRDDGTIYFLAFDVNDRAIVFRARPGAPTGPAVNPGGVVSAADGSADTLTPGAWFTIYGKNLGDAAVWTGDPNTLSLGGASVTVCGLKAVLAYNSGLIALGGDSLWQINALMPDAVPQGACPVIVTVNGETAASAMATIAGGVLTLFTFAGATSGVLPVISHGDYSVVGAAADGLKPAIPGEVLIAWGTGNCSSPVAQATVGGVNAPVLFAQRVAAGLCQINFKVPDGLSGRNALQLSTSPHQYSLIVQ
jgi:uncharacterized protein (TIGR03437 family)